MFKEHPVFILLPIASAPISSPIVDQHPIATSDNEPIEDVDPIVVDVGLVTADVGLITPDVIMDIPLRSSKRECRPSISDDYIVYLQEHEYDVGDVSDPTTCKEVIGSPQSNFSIDAMKEEMTSMS